MDLCLKAQLFNQFASAWRAQGQIRWKQCGRQSDQLRQGLLLPRCGNPIQLPLALGYLCKAIFV